MSSEDAQHEADRPMTKAEKKAAMRANKKAARKEKRQEEYSDKAYLKYEDDAKRKSERKKLSAKERRQQEREAKFSSKKDAEDTYDAKSKPHPAKPAFKLYQEAMEKKGEELAAIKDAWKDLDPDARQTWKDKAAKDKARHRKQMDEWKANVENTKAVRGTKKGRQRM